MRHLVAVEGVTDPVGDPRGNLGEGEGLILAPRVGALAERAQELAGEDGMTLGPFAVGGGPVLLRGGEPEEGRALQVPRQAVATPGGGAGRPPRRQRRPSYGLRGGRGGGQGDLGGRRLGPHLVEELARVATVEDHQLVAAGQLGQDLLHGGHRQAVPGQVVVAGIDRRQVTLAGPAVEQPVTGEEEQHEVVLARSPALGPGPQCGADRLAGGLLVDQVADMIGIPREAELLDQDLSGLPGVIAGEAEPPQARIIAAGILVDADDHRPLGAVVGRAVVGRRDALAERQAGAGGQEEGNQRHRHGCEPVWRRR